jgi:D-alanyl-D-alanine carboxypeptidase (penicillin-binding protein 5/6)
MFAEVNSKVSLESLLKSTVIQSGNDAAIALAEHTAGSELGFAQMMNEAARSLGLSHSSFANSTGLPAESHHMSAEDIGRLSIAIIRDYPEFYKWYAEKSFRHNDITQYNRNKLIWKDSSVDGLKTGHTEEAGFCLVGSAKRGDQRWVAVVLGSTDEKTREKSVLDLLNYGFAAFRPVRMLDRQGGLTSAAVFSGEVDEVLLQAESAVNLVVPAGREKDVKVEMQTSPYYQAPIESGQPMGIATLTLDGKVLADVPLVAMSSIKLGSWWKRLLDSVKLKMREFSADDDSASAGEMSE